MKASDLDLIERELGIRLPAVYRDWISSRPSLPGAIAKQVAVVDSPDELLAVNRECRRSAFPPHLFAIGFAENGGYAYGLDLSRDPAPVVTMGFDDRKLTEQAPDLHTWATELSEAARRESAEARAKLTGKKDASWWRPWKR